MCTWLNRWKPVNTVMNIFIVTVVFVSCGTVQHSCRLYIYIYIYIYHITPCHDLLERHSRNTDTPSPFLVLSPHACRHPVPLYWQPCTWLPTIVAWHTCVITVTTHDVSKRKFLWPKSNKTAVLKHTKHSSGNEIIEDYLRRKTICSACKIIWKTLTWINRLCCRENIIKAYLRRWM